MKHVKSQSAGWLSPECLEKCTELKRSAYSQTGNERHITNVGECCQIFLPMKKGSYPTYSPSFNFILDNQK